MRSYSFIFILVVLILTNSNCKSMNSTNKTGLEKKVSFFSQLKINFKDISTLLQKSDRASIYLIKEGQTNKRKINELEYIKIRKLSFQEWHAIKELMNNEENFDFSFVKNCIFLPKIGIRLENHTFAEKNIDLLFDFNCNTCFISNNTQTKQVEIDNFNKEIVKKFYVYLEI